MEREMKKQTAEYKDIKGLLTDVNINNNVGNPTFDNLSLTPIGKLTKRKGWTWYKQYEEDYRDIANLKIDYDRLSTGSQGYPNPSVFHYRGFKDTYLEQSQGRISGEWSYKLYAKIYLNEGGLWARRDGDSFSNINLPKRITTNAQFDGRGNIKFVESPKHVYIVNDFKDGENSKDILKYSYDKYNVGVLYEDKCYNTSIGSNLITRNYPTQTKWQVRAELKQYKDTVGDAPKKSIPVGIYEYLFLPVYNTGSIGDPIFKSYSNSWDVKNIYVPEGAYTQQIAVPTPTIPGTYNSIAFYALPIKDPFITHIRIYRTKNLAGKPENINKFYFCYQVAKPSINYEINLNVSNISYYYTNPAEIFYADVLQDSELSGDTLVEKLLSNRNASMRGTCACYAQNRLFVGGDRRYVSSGFVSELDKSDSFGALIYNFELASNNNEQTSIEEVGNNIYWFLQHSLYVLRPTSDTDIPYTKELISPTVGCDSLNSSCVLDNICYFIFNEKLWALNEFGQYKEISAAVNTQLTGKATGSEIVLRANASERFIKIMYRTSLGEAVNIDYYPVLDLYRKHVGKKDIYGISGSTAVLESGNEHYQLINYQHVPDLGESWGVDIDGNIVKETTDYQDTSLGNQKVTWNDYTADSTAAIRTYSVDGIMEKPFVFNSRVRFNSVVLFGSGDIDFAYKVDNGSYSDYKTVTMTRTGVEIPLNGVGTIHSIKLRHTANSDIDYDYMRVKWTAQTSVDISNNVDTGS